MIYLEIADDMTLTSLVGIYVGVGGDENVGLSGMTSRYVDCWLRIG